ncbi:hypothetical protein [Dyella amyloliquefaciens]|uniref:hypothetical protein n=1 Tax=Dyella amyloliquefaciens TaxID=1770545 RepID=UPI00102E29A7|nr:hypothetical protein [Dyella amyloliquefaciens]
MVAASTLVRANEPQAAEIKKPGQWDASAVYLWPGPTDIADAPQGPRIATVRSPDGKFALRVNENELAIDGPKGATVARKLDIDDLAEVSWGPDSREFAVTASDGGWVGTWAVTVYAVESTGVRKYDVSQPIAARFQARKGGCDEIPNVAAAGWLAPDVLLIVAEAPPHSSCKDMGAIRGYELSVRDGKIRREYNSSQLAANFGNRLGERLQGR